MSTQDAKIKETVRESYGDIARRFASSCAVTPVAPSCCGSPDAAARPPVPPAHLNSDRLRPGRGR